MIYDNPRLKDLPFKSKTKHMMWSDIHVRHKVLDLQFNILWSQGL